MRNIFSTVTNSIFPKTCFGCKREGEYLCYDCQSTIDILMFHSKYQGTYLSDLYFATSYHNRLIKELIKRFEGEPFVKEIAKPFSSMIISHFKLIENEKDFSNYSLMPICKNKKELRWIGYNPSEEIAKNLSDFFNSKLLRNNEVSKNILLVDSVFSKNREMENQAKILKEKGAEQVIGIALARE